MTSWTPRSKLLRRRRVYESPELPYWVLPAGVLPHRGEWRLRSDSGVASRGQIQDAFHSPSVGYRADSRSVCKPAAPSGCGMYIPKFLTRNQRLKCECGGYWFPHRRGGGACDYSKTRDIHLALRTGDLNVILDALADYCWEQSGKPGGTEPPF